MAKATSTKRQIKDLYASLIEQAALENDEKKCPCPYGFWDMIPELHPEECDECEFLGMMRSMAGVICRADEYSRK